MFSFSKHKILKDHLAFKKGRFPDCNWRLKDSSLSFLTDYVSEILNNTGDPSVEGVEILKLTRRKGVYRVFDPDDSSRSFILKMFFLRHFSHRLSSHKYGLDEAANFITASNRGVNTPELLGFGQYYARSGLVRTGVVVTEDLRGYSTFGELLEKSDKNQHRELLTKVIPVFQSLYLSGCNHIDVNRGAIMLSEDESNKKTFLLDFQHARFYDTVSMEILMFEVAYFARTCRKMVSSESVMAWRDDLLTVVGVTDADELQKTKELFDYYFNYNKDKPSRATLSRKQRKRIR